LFLVEYKKYDLEYNYRSSKVFNDINIAVQNSLKNDVSTILTLKNNEITKQQISDIVETYSTEHDSKTGLVYIVEKLDKLNSEVVVWVTFFDIGSQKVLLTKRVIGSVGGFGFRNYWMRGFYEVFKYSGRKLHKWVKE